MAAPTDHPQTPAERLISVAIQSTWLLWLLGGLYIAGPVLGWVLLLLACWQAYVDPTVGARFVRLPLLIWLWVIGMAAMLLILWIGHANFDLGTGKTIKSSIGWAKGWALIALFPLAGALLQVREQVIYRAICRLGLQTLVLLPLFLAAPFIGLPETLWVSPLKIVGGPGPEYFATTLYTIEPGAGTPRWQFFAPWSPAAGMIAVIYVLLAARDKSGTWRTVGIIAGLMLALLSQSRLAMVALIVIPPIVWGLGRIDKAWIWFLAAPAMVLLGIVGPALLEFFEALMSDFSAARADSSRVRETLGRIAIERWQAEAYWFGHGIVENGPHLVEYMPIGSHHSWYGLLFVKGLAGAVALAIPLFSTLLALAWGAREGSAERMALAMTLTLVLYSFGENLEILAYLFWPALVLLGKVLAQEDSQKGKSEA
ncbi:O-antigen ligase domain-containing protein [Aurantiacibacter suaedae]|uniref:O-antigen ligase domain-containing protein n=1 Tax=Aurantiacibacter suaedae TaxID=2545755 RepID=UPI0010F4AB80|nr:O-antigen ligase domain-containing protein [Aurantiacibacter suaedae]